MKRIPEPEFMLDEKQAEAYLQADFSTPHNHFVTLFEEKFPEWNSKGRVLDLGCGTCDVVARFARKYSDCTIDAVDGSAIMLEYARRLLKKQSFQNRVNCIHDVLKPTKLNKIFDATICNSLLHHLSEPMVLWESIRKYTKSDSPIFIMDLLRPDSETTAHKIVNQYALDEADILKHDFYHSLLAAYRQDEIQEQLLAANLSNLTIEQVSDRHLIIYGVI